jgi:two-component system response regulator FlrC
MIVEDDTDLREALYETLSLKGFNVVAAESAEDAIVKLKNIAVNLVISDVNMPGIDGHALLVKLKADYPTLPIILMTAFGQVEKAVQAVQQGAADYLVKPFEPQVLLSLIKRILPLNDAGDKQNQPIAEAPSSQQMLTLASRVAQSDSTVLISGESGTGKEVLARFIHDESSRKKAPFIAINCAAIPENMLEATLFGYEKGAFTGAYQTSPGKFEQANGGTLLLDEISEMDLGLQAKLLRVIQEREVERIGGRKVIKLDVRIIATTNRDLQAYVKEGNFREDLFYRLSVFPMRWLPLRERIEDIIPLTQRLLKHHCKRMNKQEITLDTSAKGLLKNHPWPGNVRELDNVIQRALILQQGNTIGAQDISLQVSDIHASENSVNNDENKTHQAQLGSEIKQHEYQIIIDTLKTEQGRRKQAAEKLGISPRTLRYKLAQMKESGIDLEQALSA